MQGQVATCPYCTGILFLPIISIRFAVFSGIIRNSRNSEALNATLSSAIDAMNTKFARVEQIRKFAIAPQPFSLEGGELTPTLKVKRAFVTRKYAELIDGLYETDAR